MTRTIAVADRSDSGRPDVARAAEAAVWARHGLAPVERLVDIAQPRLRLRALEVGRGRPIVLVHGTVGPAGWASFVEAMGGEYRFIVLDRPGWGGSDRLDYRHLDYHAITSDILRQVMDGLAIDRAVVVGGSIGDVWALSLAERYPTRVERVVLLGGGPLTWEVAPPAFIRLLASRLGAVVVRLPVSPARTRSILAESGHAASLAAGRIPDEFVAYRVAVSNRSPAMRDERGMIRDLIPNGAWRSDMPFDADVLRRISTPTLLVSGSHDNIGNPETWSRFVGVMPNGAFAGIEGAGHMPWFDAPDEVADRVRRFLAGDDEPPVQPGRSRSAGPT
jgi:pimeloyl-ACP methyl ester carboxylesterase